MMERPSSNYPTASLLGEFQEYSLDIAPPFEKATET